MTSPELRVELVTRRSQIPLDAERWNALVAANETNTVFQTYPDIIAIIFSFR
jgi:hypothetical protein